MAITKPPFGFSSTKYEWPKSISKIRSSSVPGTTDLIYLCVWVCVRLSVHACMHVCVYVCVHVCMQVKKT